MKSFISSPPPSHLMFGLVQHKPPWFPWFQQCPFLKQDAFKTPDGRRTKSDLITRYSTDIHT